LHDRSRNFPRPGGPDAPRRLRAPCRARGERIGAEGRLCDLAAGGLPAPGRAARRRPGAGAPRRPPCLLSRRSPGTAATCALGRPRRRFRAEAHREAEGRPEGNGAMTQKPDPTDAAESVVLECDLPEPPEQVWKALTEPALLAAWLMPNDIRPEPGARF